MSENPHQSGDFATHVKTYDTFISMTKWNVVAIVVLLILMAVFLL